MNAAIMGVWAANIVGTVVLIGLFLWAAWH